MKNRVTSGKSIHRLTALLMCICMCCGLLLVPAHAEGGSVTVSRLFGASNYGGYRLQNSGETVQIAYNDKSLTVDDIVVTPEASKLEEVVLTDGSKGSRDSLLADVDCVVYSAGGRTSTIDIEQMPGLQLREDNLIVFAESLPGWEYCQVTIPWDAFESMESAPYSAEYNPDGQKGTYLIGNPDTGKHAQADSYSDDGVRFYYHNDGSSITEGRYHIYIKYDQNLIIESEYTIDIRTLHTGTYTGAKYVSGYGDNASGYYIVDSYNSYTAGTSLNLSAKSDAEISAAVGANDSTRMSFTMDSDVLYLDTSDKTIVQNADISDRTEFGFTVNSVSGSALNGGRATGTINLVDGEYTVDIENSKTLTAGQLTLSVSLYSMRGTGKPVESSAVPVSITVKVTAGSAETSDAAFAVDHIFGAGYGDYNIADGHTVQIAADNKTLTAGDVVVSTGEKLTSVTLASGDEGTAESLLTDVSSITYGGNTVTVQALTGMQVEEGTILYADSKPGWPFNEVAVPAGSFVDGCYPNDEGFPAADAYSIGNPDSGKQAIQNITVDGKTYNSITAGSASFKYGDYVNNVIVGSFEPGDYHLYTRYGTLIIESENTIQVVTTNFGTADNDSSELLNLTAKELEGGACHAETTVAKGSTRATFYIDDENISVADGAITNIVLKDNFRKFGFEGSSATAGITVPMVNYGFVGNSKGGQGIEGTYIIDIESTDALTNGEIIEVQVYLIAMVGTGTEQGRSLVPATLKLKVNVVDTLEETGTGDLTIDRLFGANNYGDYYIESGKVSVQLDSHDKAFKVKDLETNYKNAVIRSVTMQDGTAGNSDSLLSQVSTIVYTASGTDYTVTVNPITGVQLKDDVVLIADSKPGWAFNELTVPWDCFESLETAPYSADYNPTGLSVQGTNNLLGNPDTGKHTQSDSFSAAGAKFYYHNQGSPIDAGDYNIYIKSGQNLIIESQNTLRVVTDDLESRDPLLDILAAEPESGDYHAAAVISGDGTKATIFMSGDYISAADHAISNIDTTNYRKYSFVGESGDCTVTVVNFGEVSTKSNSQGIANTFVIDIENEDGFTVGQELDIDLYLIAKCGTGFEQGRSETPATIKVVVSTFKDICGEWFAQNVEYAAENGLMDGIGNSLFAPYTNASRAMIVTVLYRLNGSPAVSGTNSFTDLSQDWYKDAVQWAVENGITNGVSDNEFAPDRAATRQEMITFFYRYSQYAGLVEKDYSGNDMSRFTDFAKAGNFAAEAIKWSVAEGIIEGTSATELSPLESCSRAELATVIARFHKALNG
ncbi:MAG: S-layer homology domain-containing protein [Oscillospiraceae bacterium]